MDSTNYSFSVEIDSGLKPAGQNTFPIAQAKDILMPDGRRLDAIFIPVSAVNNGMIIEVKDGMWQAVALEDSIIKKYIDELFADGGGEEPEVPIVTKLTTPSIRLVVDGSGDEGGDEGGDTPSTDMTPAILGVAVLGRTILGKVAVLPKLATPTIRLTTSDDGSDTDEPEVPVVTKLAAPVIRLVTDGSGDDSGEGDEPSTDMTPAILGVAILGKTILGKTIALPKLDAPVIRIEVSDNGGNENPENPVVTKLTAPVIRLVTADDTGEDPETPAVTKLATPTIRIEIVDDSGGEPDEPEDPVVTQLEKPTIRLEVVEDVEDILPAPTNLRINSYYVTWDAVSGAAYHEAYIIDDNGNKQCEQSSVNTFDIRKYCPTAGTYTVYVTAYETFDDVDIGNHGKIASIEVVVPEAPTNVAINTTADGDILSWYQESYITHAVTVVAQGEDVYEHSYTTTASGGFNLSTATSSYDYGVYDVYVRRGHYGEAAIISYEKKARLEAPVIRLEEVDNSGGSDDPVITKLNAPEIYLYAEAACTHSNYTSTITKAATCTDAGEETFTCSDCGYVWTQVIVATGHVYEETVIGPTCTEEGYTIHSCGNCGDQFINSQVEALGHNWGEPQYDDETLLYGRTCLRCGVFEELEAPLTKLAAPTIRLEEEGDHEHDYVVTVTDPTCTERGYTTYSCMACDYTYIDNYTDALGHNFGDAYYSSTDFATTGYGHKCTRCGELEELNAPTPKLTAPIIRLETFDDGGGEEPDVPTVIKLTAPTIRLEEKTTEHEHNYVTTVTEPTCTENGYTTYVCQTCNHTYVDDYTDALGHKAVNPYYSDTDFPNTGFGCVCGRCNELVEMESPVDGTIAYYGFVAISSDEIDGLQIAEVSSFIPDEHIIEYQVYVQSTEPTVAQTYIKTSESIWTREDNSVRRMFTNGEKTFFLLEEFAGSSYGDWFLIHVAYDEANRITSIESPVITKYTDASTGEVKITWPIQFKAMEYDVFVDGEAAVCNMYESTDRTMKIIKVDDVLQNYSAGNHSITVVAKFADLVTDHSNAVVCYKSGGQLDAPTIRLEEEIATLAAPTADIINDMLMWTPVDGADKYEVLMLDMNGNTKTITHTEPLHETLGFYVIFNIQEYCDTPGKWVMCVYAYEEAEDGSIITGEASNQVGTYVHETPTNTIIGDSILGWTAVDGVTQYGIRITNPSTGNDTTFLTGETSYDLTTVTSFSAPYDVQVRAIDSNGISKYSKAITYVDISAPAVNISDSVVSWNAVDNAQGYSVWTQDTSGSRYLIAYITDGTSVDISTYMSSYDEGTYYITVWAMAVGGNEHSISTDEISYTVGSAGPVLVPAPTNLRIDGIYLRWDEIGGATSYEVNIAPSDGAATTRIVTAPMLNIPYYITELGAGDYAVTVKADQGEGTSNSLASDPITITIDAAPTDVELTDGVLYWNAPYEGDFEYVVTMTHDDYGNGYTDTTTSTSYDVASYTNGFSDPGIYSVCVQIGNYGVPSDSISYDTESGYEDPDGSEDDDDGSEDDDGGNNDNGEYEFDGICPTCQSTALSHSTMQCPDCDSYVEQCDNCGTYICATTDCGWYEEP